MLALPLKRSDPYNITIPLETFITTKLKNDITKYSNDISFLQQLRISAVSSTISSEQIGIQNILHYNYHIKLLIKRLISYENELNFCFIWTDAFRPNFRCTSTSLYYDWACILWNMAAIESHRGSIIERSTDEGIRSASIQFQLSAGILEYIRNEISPKINGTRSPELHDLFLRMVTQLLLAQAQICFYEKAIRDRKNTGAMKPSLIAKLAQQVVTFYASALDICREREISIALDQSWLFHMEFQRECFRGVSEYWQSVSSKDEALQRGVGYGEEIARLQKAESVMTQVVQYGRQKGISIQTIATAESVLLTIQKARVMAEKDNSTIYHDPIPDYATLNSVVGVAMVKPSQPPEYYSTEKPLFIDILPKGTSEIMLLYKDKLQNLLQEVEKKSTAATDECRSALSAIGLPASLEIIKTGGELPDSLWKKIEQVQQMGGLSELLRKLEDVENLAERARNTIDGIENSLKREENLDRNFRQRYPDYQQPASSQLNRDIQSTTKLMLQAHETGRSNDTTLSIQLNQTQFLELMRLLGLSRQEIKDLLPRTGQEKVFSYDTKKLEALLLSIAQLIESRNQTVELLKTKIPNENLVCDRMLERINPTNGIFTDDTKLQWIQAELDILQPDIQILEDSYIKQGELLQQVYQENIIFNNARENDPSNIERDRVLKSFEQGVAAFFGYQSQLNAGGVFYRDMQSRLTTLMQQCDDLSFTQQLQRQDYETDKMRSQDRINQEMRDHEIALKLAAEIENANIAAQAQAQQSQAHNTQPPAAPQSGLQGSFLYPSAPQHGSAPYGAPSIPQAQPQAQPQPSSGPPNPYNVVYGQPINGPPPPSSYNPPTTTPQNPPTTPYNYNSTNSYQPQSYQQPQPQQHQQQLTSSLNAYEPTITRSSINQPTSNYSSSPYQPTSNYSYQPQVQSYPQAPAQSQPYSNHSYPTLPGQSPYAPQQPTISNSHTLQPSPDFEAKVQRLIEMGFDRNSVINSLNANNGDEMASLNGLLSGTQSPSSAPPIPPPATATNNNQTPAQQPAQSTSMFGRIWGK